MHPHVHIYICTYVHTYSDATRSSVLSQPSGSMSGSVANVVVRDFCCLREAVGLGPIPCVPWSKPLIWRSHADYIVSFFERLF